MKSIPSQIMKVAAVCACVAVSCLVALATPGYARYVVQSKDQGKASEGEQKALAKIESSPDVAAKLAAAGEFVKKFPKSTLRAKVVSYVAQEVNKIPDETQRVTQLENLRTVFKELSDTDVIDPILIEAYMKANRIGEAFTAADRFLSTRPNDIVTLTLMAQAGVEQAKKNNPKFAAQSKQYSERAIQVIETGKRPDSFDEEAWNQYQTKWLPQLYQWSGYFSMLAGNKDEAKNRMEKAVSLEPDDPVHYYFLGALIHEEYQKIREEYQQLSAGPLRDTKRQLAEKKIDEVVDAWAHTVALSEGNAQYQQLHDGVLADIQSYYKYRHAGSTAGLQELIDKYKKPSTVR